MAKKKSDDLTRREVVQMGAATAVAAAVVTNAVSGPYIQKVKAANSQIQLGIIGTGGRGQYHITHLNKLDGHKLVAACDIYEPNLKKAVGASKDQPQGYKALTANVHRFSQHIGTTQQEDVNTSNCISHGNNSNTFGRTGRLVSSA